MATTFQPPIILSPNQDSSQQVSFINQNFQSLASALETNSFRIVLSGTKAIPGNVGGTTTTTIRHNLGFVPAFQCYLFVTGSAVYYQIPYTSINTSTGAVQVLVTAYADSINLYFDTIVTAVGTQPWTIQYYLLQQTAS